MGGATGRVGDPSGRVQEREEVEEERVVANTASITHSLQQVFHNDQLMTGAPGPDPMYTHTHAHTHTHVR